MEGIAAKTVSCYRHGFDSLCSIYSDTYGTYLLLQIDIPTDKLDTSMGIYRDVANC